MPMGILPRKGLWDEAVRLAKDARYWAERYRQASERLDNAADNILAIETEEERPDDA